MPGRVQLCMAASGLVRVPGHWCLSWNFPSPSLTPPLPLMLWSKAPQTRLRKVRARTAGRAVFGLILIQVPPQAALADDS